MKGIRETTVHFVHISDTHIGTSRDYRSRDINTFNAATKLVKAINSIPAQPDFIIHTGDVAAIDGEVEAYKIAHEVFQHLKAPIYYVSGNHDISANLISILPNKTNKTNSYTFEVNDICFITLDGRGPREIDPHGIISQDQLSFLEEEIKSSQKPIVLFVHFPPLPLESPWIDRDMLLTNGEELHQILLKGKDKIRGVFSGHVHRGMVNYRDGILYSTVGSSFCQFIAWPNMERVAFERLPVGFFNYITVTKNSTLIKEHHVLIK